jgi:carbamoylphosphate synthase large subunit
VLTCKICVLPCGWCKRLFVTRTASDDTCSAACKKSSLAHKKAEQADRYSYANLSTATKERYSWSRSGVSGSPCHGNHSGRQSGWSA